MTAKEEQIWLDSLEQHKHTIPELLSGKAVVCEKRGELPGAPYVEVFFRENYDAVRFVQIFPEELLNPPQHVSTEDNMRDNLDYYQQDKVLSFTMKVSPENFSQILPNIPVIEENVRYSEEIKSIFAELVQEGTASLGA